MFRGMSLFCDKSSSVQFVTSRFGVCCVYAGAAGRAQAQGGWVAPQAYGAGAGLGRASGGQLGQVHIILQICGLNLHMLAS
jgi:hypothetical protein